MLKLDLAPTEALYPVPVVLVSCAGKKDERANIITIAWCGVVCSTPPLLGVSIRPSRYSHKLIKRCGDFVVNIPSEKILNSVDFCGMASGKDEDKFTACSLTAVKSSKIISPLIKECPVNIECKLKDVIRFGSHDLFVGEVLLVHADADLASGGRIDYQKAKPLVYNQGEYWNLGKKIGHYGMSR